MQDCCIFWLMVYITVQVVRWLQPRCPHRCHDNTVHVARWSWPLIFWHCFTLDRHRITLSNRDRTRPYETFIITICHTKRFTSKSTKTYVSKCKLSLCDTVFWMSPYITISVHTWARPKIVGGGVDFLKNFRGGEVIKIQIFFTDLW